LVGWLVSSAQQQLDKEFWQILLAMWLWRRTQCIYLARFQCLIFSSLFQGLVYRLLYCWTLEMMVQMAGRQFERKCLLFKVLLVTFHTSCKLFGSINVSFSQPNYIVRNHTPCFNSAFMGKPLSTYVVSINVAALAITYDIMLGDDYIPVRSDKRGIATPDC
jgi:Gpi18-like mannosyltransferase